MRSMVILVFMIYSSCGPNQPPEKIFEAWHLSGDNGINIKAAWDITTGSKDVNIAILDSGFTQDNPAFTTGRCEHKTHYVELEKTPKAKQHGTMVASVISTCENNTFNLIGINKRSNVQWVNLSTKVGAENDALLWALGEKNICKTSRFFDCDSDNSYPAHVINRSVGLASDRPDVDRRLLLPIIEQASRQSSIIVAAAGNDAINSDNDFPSSATGVISVGYTDRDGMASQYSNWGETVEIMAPGVGIPVARELGKDIVSGSSFASPIVAAVISLMRSVNPALNWKSAIYFMQSTAIPMDCHAYCIANRESAAQNQCKKDCCKGEKQTCTPGRLDAGAAVGAAKKAAVDGMINAALVDSDQYNVPMNYSPTPDGRSGEFTLRNVGGASGKYSITSPDGAFMFSHDEVVLAPMGQPKDSQKIILTTTNKWTALSPIRIASPESGVVSTFSDEIVLYTFTKYR